MENRFRVLCIAPYEGMKSLMSSLTDEYPEMDLTLFVGDRELGLEIARANFHGNYDVVISRGDFYHLSVYAIRKIIYQK